LDRHALDASGTTAQLQRLSAACVAGVGSPRSWFFIPLSAPKHVA
jgi:hypothetical protein